jgi:hypothetical protein
VNEPTIYRLHERLLQLGATEVHPTERQLTEAEISDAITSYRCEWAVCARIANKVATFAQYFQAVFKRTLDGKAVKVKVMA